MWGRLSACGRLLTGLGGNREGPARRDNIPPQVNNLPHNFYQLDSAACNMARVNPTWKANEAYPPPPGYPPTRPCSRS
jgi:hypothetical protein